MAVHVPPMGIGYWHVATEVYYNKDMSGYYICNGSGEDDKCADQWNFPWDYS